jgi:hypothetical protein
MELPVRWHCLSGGTACPLVLSDGRQGKLPCS